MDESTFAQKTLRAYQLYLALAERETEPAFKRALEELAHTSREQFGFWARKAPVRGDAAVLSRFELRFFRTVRRLFGLRTTLRLIVGRKERRIEEYKRYCKTCTVPGDASAIEAFVERFHAILEGLHTLPK